jgi:hypothetical protein
MIRAISMIDILNPLLKANYLAGWSSRHITKNERVIRRRILRIKFHQQYVKQPSHVCLVSGTRMMCYQSRQPGVLALIPYPTRPVKRMKSGGHQTRRIPDIMKVRRRYQQIAILLWHRSSTPTGLRCNVLDMRPAITKR